MEEKTIYSEDSVYDSPLEKEYDGTFDGDTKTANLLNLTADKYVRTQKVINLSEIVASAPLKNSRKDTSIGLTKTVCELGVVTPIHVMAVGAEDEDYDYKYILIDGLRRMYGAMKNGLTEIDAIVWDFNDKELGKELLLPLSLLLNRSQKRSWSEVWDLYRVLEMRSQVTPGTLEYLLQLNGGDAMKLKDVMLCDYQEVKDMLINNEKDLEGCYRALQKLRKEENQLLRDDSTGFSDTAENAEEMASNVGSEKQLSDDDVRELLEMADDLDEMDDISSDDFGELNKGIDEGQKVGERHPLDPALKSAVLSRDDFRCKCCGFGGAAALGVLAVHHILPVHVGGKDVMDNLTTLCLNHHILLHVAERNGGKLQMTQDDFNKYSSEEQLALKKTLKLAKIAVDADRRRNMSLDDVRKATTDSIRHPMPGMGLNVTQAAYSVAQQNKNDKDGSDE